MDSITIYPKNEQQKSLLKSLLEEMKVSFEVGSTAEQTLLSESEFIAKIDNSINQVASKQTKTLTKELQKQFLGL
jgi:hypothetical protein